jgi:hypothetical protein
VKHECLFRDLHPLCLRLINLPLTSFVMTPSDVKSRADPTRIGPGLGRLNIMSPLQPSLNPELNTLHLLTHLVELLQEGRPQSISTSPVNHQPRNYILSNPSTVEPETPRCDCTPNRWRAWRGVFCKVSVMASDRHYCFISFKCSRLENHIIGHQQYHLPKILAPFPTSYICSHEWLD